MASISKADLRKKITEILKDGAPTLTAAKVREQLEEDLDIDLLSRKKEIEGLVKQYKDSTAKNGDKESDDNEEEEDDEDEQDTKKGVKRGSTSKTPAKRAKKDDSEDVSEDEDSDEEFAKKAKPPKTRKLPPKKKRGSDSDSDDWKKKKGKRGGGGAKKGSGYTKTLKLSPELASLVGQDSMARHEVVKKVWAIIKERNLYDPKNKQFAICDDALFKVIGTKRFRTFGMMKYLKDHFIV